MLQAQGTHWQIYIPDELELLLSTGGRAYPKDTIGIGWKSL
jgi:hypothetical protein